MEQGWGQFHHIPTLDIPQPLGYNGGMDLKTYNVSLKLLVSKDIKEALAERSKQNLRSMNAEANYILGKDLGVLE